MSAAGQFSLFGSLELPQDRLTVHEDLEHLSQDLAAGLAEARDRSLSYPRMNDRPLNAWAAPALVMTHMMRVSSVVKGGHYEDLRSSLFLVVGIILTWITMLDSEEKRG